jgi:hypothetical protein
MAIKRKKKHGRVYLEEYKSIRKGDKVESVYVRSLGPEDPVTRRPKPRPKVLDRLDHGPSHRAGDVALLWELARELDMVNIIDGVCCDGTGLEGPTPGKLLTAWAINRAIDPVSNTKLENWIPTTDLPRLMRLSPADFSREALLTALDFVCYEDQPGGRVRDLSPRVDDALYRRWRELHALPAGERETLAYDLTSVLFFGVSCPMAELGYNPDRIKRRQVNLALVVSRIDRFPLLHFVYNGSRNTASTVMNLISSLQESSVEPGTIIWDRGSVSGRHVRAVETAGWQLICGVPKSVGAAIDVLNATEVKCTHRTLARSSKAGHVYAQKAKGRLYGGERTLVVYTNRERGVREADARNEALATIDEGLRELAGKASTWGERRIREEAGKIIGGYKELVVPRVRRKGDGPPLTWGFKKRKLQELERLDGRWLLLSTDPKLSAREVVNTYMEKDFIEKVFRTLKTSEEVEPVRHRLERRVRAYLFLCVLAYRLLAMLQHRLGKISTREDRWERADTLLGDLARVERVQVRLGHQVKTWYLNVSGESRDVLDKIGYKKLLTETVEVDLKV